MCHIKQVLRTCHSSYGEIGVGAMVRMAAGHRLQVGTAVPKGSSQGLAQQLDFKTDMQGWTGTGVFQAKE